MSASTVGRLKEKRGADLIEWCSRPLADLEVVYVSVNGVYIKAGLEWEKAAAPIPYSQKLSEAQRLRDVFIRSCRQRSYKVAAKTLVRDWESMARFFDFPKEHTEHLGTTNAVESSFAALRLRTNAAKRYRRVDRVVAVIWKMLMVAESRFRRLQFLELMIDVYRGAKYADGIAVKPTVEKVTA